MSHKRYFNIISAFYNNYFKDLGNVKLIEESNNINDIKFTVIPFEGIHKDKEYTVILNFYDEKWPLIFINSEIYDKIKTNQYLQNKGKVGNHKGICIKNLSYCYAFKKNFKKYCGDKWENYIYNLIVNFNNLQDFEKGNGIKSNYKDVLNLV
jgi:hypothetical protein